MHIDIVSIFPEYLKPLRLSLLGKAIRDGLLAVEVHDLRDWTHDRHRRVDDTPYGGGAGMVMRPEPWGEVLDSIIDDGREAYGETARPVLLVPTPSGRRFDQQLAAELAVEPWLIFACGRYEGIDQRVIDDAANHCRVLPFSLGDYVLNGGEVAALAAIEAVGRLIPGVVGNPESLVEESHSDGLLEYPVYTKPPVWRDHRVPEVLLGGDHGAITRWRTEQSKIKTAATRPDLLHPSQALIIGGLEDAELRLAQRGDIAELHLLTRGCWVSEALANERLDIPALHETLEEFTADLANWTTLVLRSHGRLIGSVRGRYAEHAWEIGRLMVTPDLQGQGIGRWLLDRIEQLAPEPAEEYWLFTGDRSRRNLRMYRKAGYRPAPWRPVSQGEMSLVKRR